MTDTAGPLSAPLSAEEEAALRHSFAFDTPNRDDIVAVDRFRAADSALAIALGHPAPFRDFDAAALTAEAGPR